ncbi:MAG: S8 family serine peptidase, partial [Candidatus Hermodarchaeota archaeon]
MRRLNIIKCNGFIILFILHFSLLCSFNSHLSTASIPQKPVIKISSLSTNTPTTYSELKYLKHYFGENQEELHKIYSNEDEIEIFNAIYKLINPQKLIDDRLNGENVTIAILDSGINNNSWITNVVARYTTISNSNVVKDDNGHGTFVGSIISRIAPKAKLISIKVSDSSGFASFESVKDGLELA